MVNSLFDPIGFVAPITIQDNLFLREILSVTTNWDEPLPKERLSDWQSWRDSLQRLQELHIPRTFSSFSFSEAIDREIHIFSNASETAIAAVAYLKLVYDWGSSQLGFVLGKAKVAPLHGHTIPRLKLCGAVLAAEITEEHLGIPTTLMHFYTDSKVVLDISTMHQNGFMCTLLTELTEVYNSRSVVIRLSTEKNPADSATRSIAKPPLVARSASPTSSSEIAWNAEEPYPLMDPDGDKEIRPSVRALKTEIGLDGSIGSHRFERFSVWEDLIDTITFLKNICASLQ